MGSDFTERLVDVMADLKFELFVATPATDRVKTLNAGGWAGFSPPD
jgi:hypothetical protein